MTLPISLRAISVVVPLYNEEETIALLHEELSAVAGEHGYDAQFIFVDDGSTDSSWREIEKLAAADERVHGIRFRRNFGKAAALSAGFEAAQGEVVFTMDADLQDDPHEMPAMLAKLDEGFDVISGWKKVRHDPITKTFPSHVFNWLVSHLTGVKLHDHNCGLKCYRRDVLHEVRLYGELHRFVPVLAEARGFKVAEVVVHHRARTHGHSKYGPSRFIKGLLDLLTVKFITGYGDRPQHALGAFGLVAFVGGALWLVVLACRWVLTRTIDSWTPLHLHETAALYYSLGLMLVGSQFLAVGLLGEMIAAYLARDRDTFSIAEHTGPRDGVEASGAEHSDLESADSAESPS